MRHALGRRARARRGKLPRAEGSGIRGAWEQLRKRPEFSAIVGGVRVLEVTHAEGKGWHAHYHCILEVADSERSVPCIACDGRGSLPRRRAGAWVTVRCRSCSSQTQRGDGTMPAAIADLLRAWAMLVDGTTAAQCCVALDDANAGQLAKYLTKPWELSDTRARELFDAAASLRLVNTWGAWHGRDGVRITARVESRGRDWFQGPLVADVERMHPRSYITFGASLPLRLEPVLQSEVDAVRRLRWAQHERERKCSRPAVRPWLDVHRMTAGEYLRRLAADQRRADEHEPASEVVDRPGRRELRVAASRDGPYALRFRPPMQSLAFAGDAARILLTQGRRPAPAEPATIEA